MSRRLTGCHLVPNGKLKQTDAAIYWTLVECLFPHGRTFANGPVVRLDLMASLIVCSAAEKDYAESLCWYASRSTALASDFDDEFDRALSQILCDPLRFPSCGLRHRYYLMRRFPFRVIYRIDGEDVVVVAVAHTARSPDYWTNR